jgi:hypothetical protein
MLQMQGLNGYIGRRPEISTVSDLLAAPTLHDAFPGEPTHLIDLMFGALWGACGGISFAAMVGLIPMGLDRAIRVRGRRRRLAKFAFMCILYFSILVPCVWWWTAAAARELHFKETHPTRCRIVKVDVVNATEVKDWETGAKVHGWRFVADVRPPRHISWAAESWLPFFPWKSFAEV